MGGLRISFIGVILMGKPEVRLENWQQFGGGMWGQAYGHPRFDDGTQVRTSFIVKEPEEFKEGAVVETNNTLYILGKEYEEPKSRD